MPKGITDVVFEESWGHSPAKIHRYTGGLVINEDYLPRIKNKNHWYYILGHEATHARKNTMSEFVADEGASELYFKKGLSPRDSVTALANVLSFTNPEHTERVRRQFIRAAKHDCTVNGHKASCEMLKETTDDRQRTTEREFNFADFCGPLCRKKQRKINAAVANALANSSVVTQAATAAVTVAAQQQQQNAPPPADPSQQQSNQQAPQQNQPSGTGGGGGGNGGGGNGPSSPDDGGDGGDDGSDDGSFTGRIELAEVQQKRDDTMSAFCGPICQMRKSKEEAKISESKDKVEIAKTNAAAATEQEKSDNAQKAVEAKTAAEQTEAVAKSLKEDSKAGGGVPMPVIIGLVLLLVAGGVFFYIKHKKKTT